MQGKTTKVYYDYRLRQIERERQIGLEKPGPSIQQFWREAYDFNPLARHNSDLVQMVASKKLKRIPLGRLYGTKLELEPDLRALDESYARVYNIPLQRLMFLRSVSFYECHPSEDKNMIKVKSDKDALLRRFLCLGWVIKLDDNEWVRTGHVLVIDMDEAANKKRHPWFLLASEWYDDHCLYPDGDRTI